MRSFTTTSLVRIAAFLCAAAALMWLLRWSGFAPFLEERGPLAFRIGAVDRRFGITTDRVRALAEEAASAWGVPVGEALFVYDSTARLSINLVFDDRQQRWLDSKQLRHELAANDDEAKRLSVGFEDRLRTQTERHHDLERRQADLERRRLEHNARVQIWNEKGGAPPDVVAELDAAGAALEREQERLAREVDEVNDYIRETNRLISEHNALVDKGNEAIQEYNATHDTTAMYHKGVFDGDRMTITVYQMENDDDLRFTLAHELGHALGFPDTRGDTTAVMHFAIGGQDKRHLALRPDDVRLVRERVAKER